MARHGRGQRFAVGTGLGRLAQAGGECGSGNEGVGKIPVHCNLQLRWPAAGSAPAGPSFRRSTTKRRGRTGSPVPCKPWPGAGRLPSHQGSGVAPDSGVRGCAGAVWIPPRR
ncbi:hypothetical protein CBM2609_A70407 [Cupriavidus taiwanensis]|nr:hypothetical protein CBM2604_A60405 [Cupriavidus taiwanensis]SOZ29114.1 hypothetical protein CBM2609_A70407 [Cupriavidus taiwanensis]SOZ46575.1 hypothetical protein CBM2610_A80362 [Cupriavidus taiwanensis]